MNQTLVIVSIVLALAALILYILKRRAELRMITAQKEAAVARQEAGNVVAAAQKAYDEKAGELEQEIARVRKHYEREARRNYEAAQQIIAELEPLRVYATLQDAEVEVREKLSNALLEVEALRQEAASLIDKARSDAGEERKKAQQRAAELRVTAEAALARATRDAGQLMADAEKRAEQIGGEAYEALRNHRMLEEAVRAIRNIVDGYGDQYVIPTHSLLDDLAADFGYTEAGEALRNAREQSRRMVEEGQAAACDYAEANRRVTAIRFVVDAFNGRVDAVLSTVRHNNFGTLEQQIRDAFSLVNLNGQAFRNARILPAYLDSRLAELKWAVVVQELKQKERDEQRIIQERIREEEKARRDYERALQEVAKEEAKIKQLMERAQAEVAHATAAERSRIEAQMADLNRRLAEAEAKGQRALSMAQQTRAGNVYVISNIGSFGDEVVKIGMTRRLEPLDRIKELGDASVPFEFDVHAMIKSDDAPALERLLHEQFDAWRINKVNYRKEFFRLPVENIRAFAAAKGLEATFTLAAEAREYRETLALEKMSPEERKKYQVREEALDVDLTSV